MAVAGTGPWGGGGGGYTRRAIRIQDVVGAVQRAELSHEDCLVIPEAIWTWGPRGSADHRDVIPKNLSP